MSFHLRPADPFKEAQAIARLLSLLEADPITAEVVQDRQRKILPASVQQHLLVEDPAGNVIGMATAIHVPYEPTGYFNIQIVVDQHWRRQGIGTLLYDTLRIWCRDRGAIRLHASIRDNCPKYLEFATRRGFTVDQHRFEAVLDVLSFDAAPFADIVPTVQASGIHFFSLADTTSEEAMLRRLYKLNTVTGLDIPGNTGDAIRPFEQFILDVTGGYWFRPEGQIFAGDGDRWVGMAAVGAVAPQVMYNMHTGVLSEYRGRGIAQALKLLAINYARQENARWIRTHNDSRNAPMIAINRKLGYRPEPGWYQMRLSFPEDARADI